MPLKTAVPSERRISAPAPCAITNGTTPRMKAKDVIRIGRSRSLHASTVACQPGAGARRGVTRNGGRRIHVVAQHHDRPAGVADIQHRAQPDNLPLIIAYLQLPDIGNLAAEARVGLDVYLPGPAELVEIVDVI